MPVIAAAIWGRFVSPKACQRLDDPLRVTVEIVFFGGAATAMASAGAATTAAIFGAAAAVGLVLMSIFGQRPPTATAAPPTGN